MRTAICAVTSLLAMTCAPVLAGPPEEQLPSAGTVFSSGDMGNPIEAVALESYSAGTMVYNNIRPDGLVESNTAFNVATGMNAITEGAFTNASGLPIVIQNSGANVLIQNATIINVDLQ